MSAYVPTELFKILFKNQSLIKWPKIILFHCVTTFYMLYTFVTYSYVRKCYVNLIVLLDQHFIKLLFFASSMFFVTNTPSCYSFNIVVRMHKYNVYNNNTVNWVHQTVASYNHFIFDYFFLMLYGLWTQFSIFCQFYNFIHKTLFMFLFE